MSEITKNEVYDGMKYVELQKILGERILKCLDESLTPEERQEENEQTALIWEGAKQMVNVGDLVLRTEKLKAQTKTLTHSAAYEMIW